MKIRITGEGHNILIPVPTRLIFSRLSVSLWLKFVRKAVKENDKYLPDSVEEKTDALVFNLSDEAVYALCREILRIKHRYGEWTLVDVQSASGEKVLITL